MGVAFALAAAVAYGLSDFLGGLVGRRTSPWPVAVLAAVGGLVGAVGLALALPGAPTTVDLLWGAAAGIGSGAGSAFLYRGLATGRMAVVAPLSAVGAAVLPVAVGLVLGERPGGLVWIGMALALPGIWLVARMPDTPGSAPDSSGVVDGILAGLGFGLLFVAMGQVPDGAGYWPVAAAQAVALVVVVVMALALRQSWVPTAAVEAWGLVAGLLATAAVLAFLLATQTGLLTVAAVLTSLYPAVTVLLAAMVLREPIFRAQALGLALCALAVGLVTAG